MSRLQPVATDTNRRYRVVSVIILCQVELRNPANSLLDQEQCYRFLLETLHLDGLHCPNGHPLPEGLAPHDRKRAPLVKYRCRNCGAVFNIFTGTVWGHPKRPANGTYEERR